MVRTSVLILLGMTLQLPGANDQRDCPPSARKVVGALRSLYPPVESLGQGDPIPRRGAAVPGMHDPIFGATTEVRGTGEVILNAGELSAGTAIPTLRISATVFPYPDFEGQIVQSGGRDFRVLDVGLRTLERDRPSLDDAYSSFQPETGPLRSVRIVPEGARRQAIEKITAFRDAAHRRVLAVYQSEKSHYLQPEDFRSLDRVRLSEQNSHVFVVLGNGGRAPDSLSPTDFEGSLLLTIQLSYLGSHHPAIPSRVQAHQFPESTLPHVYRIRNPEIRAAAEARLGELAARARVAEITRYARFGEVPGNVHARMLLSLFERASDPISGVDVLLINVDAATREQFARYRFSLVGALETDPLSPVPEFLMSLDVHSQAFRDTVADLRRRASQ